MLEIGLQPHRLTKIQKSHLWHPAKHGGLLHHPKSTLKTSLLLCQFWWLIHHVHLLPLSDCRCPVNSNFPQEPITGSTGTNLRCFGTRTRNLTIDRFIDRFRHQRSIPCTRRLQQGCHGSNICEKKNLERETFSKCITVSIRKPR